MFFEVKSRVVPRDARMVRGLPNELPNVADELAWRALKALLVEAVGLPVRLAISVVVALEDVAHVSGGPLCVPCSR